MPKGAAFLRLVPATGSTAAHFKTRLRFSKSRPWCHLPDWLDEAGAVAFASILRGTARAGYAIEWQAGPGGLDGRWRALVELVDGAIVEVPLDEQEHDQALAHAATLARKARARGLAVNTTGENAAALTCSEWWTKHLADREGRGQSSVKDARGRFKNWIEPEIGNRPMAKVTRGELEAVVRKLDAAIASGALSWKSAANVWGEVTSAFGRAAKSKVPALRVRDDNPTEGVEGPDGGVAKEKPILYPDELVALLSCGRVPLYRRRVYAAAVYLGARANELAAITAADVDLAHGRIAIAKQVDRQTGDNRQTKTRRARSFDVEAEIVPLLELLVEERPTGRLLHLPPDEDRAELLRKDLDRAGVTRDALHVEDDASRTWIKFHNLRDTCLTWMALRGDDPMRIQWRGGHTDFRTTQGYLAAGQNLGRGVGQPFPPLPAELLVPVGTDDGSTAWRRRASVDQIVDQKKTKPQNL